MAQHVKVYDISDRAYQDSARVIDSKDGAIERIVSSILQQSTYRTSMLYRETAHNVFETDRRVPESIVKGGRATFEVHTDRDKTVRTIYLVA